ncbi:unnamed protein product [Effrenium voratum]|nr:unnamed protein product [Effrenium voratum]
MCLFPLSKACGGCGPGLRTVWHQLPSAKLSGGPKSEDLKSRECPARGPGVAMRSASQRRPQAASGTIEASAESQSNQRVEDAMPAMPAMPSPGGFGGDGEALHTTIRLQNARILALQEELDKAITEATQRDSEVQQLRQENKQVSEEGKRLQKTNASLEQSQEKLKKQVSALESKTKDLEVERAELTKARDQLDVKMRKAEADSSSKEARLNRLTEECEKLKAAAKDANLQERDRVSSDRREVDRLTNEVRKLERQRTELVTAFKKQMKLIEVLKRQRAHMEAARVLSFTEDEFIRILELGDKIMEGRLQILAKKKKGEESEDSEDEEGGDKLPSASKAFKTLNAMGEEGLSFKKHEKERGKKDRVRMHQMSLDRVTTASAATLRGQGWLPGNDAKQAVLPEEVAGKRPRGDEEEKANESKGQGKGKGKMSVKDLTKLKRFKGQSGLDHNGKTWKPEIWMTMRQEYD